MCGIAGILNLDNNRDPVDEHDLRRMLGMIRHRGPDEFGIYLAGPVGLGNARLSIIDLSGGQQPISNEDGTLWIVFNGEIFNYVELKPELQALGHRFATSSDTEVLLHAYEQWGEKCLERFNGQFAFAIWNARDRSLFLARDRLGVRPLFYTVQGGRVVFGSEIKAILGCGNVRAEIDPAVLEQVFTFWSPISPATIFKGIVELPPGHYLELQSEPQSGRVLSPKGPLPPQSGRVLSPKGPLPGRLSEATEGLSAGNSQPGQSGRGRPRPRLCPIPSNDKTDIRVIKYWELKFPEEKVGFPGTVCAEAYQEQLATLLIDAAKIRLRADVPVGAYLSGGLDSSIIASIIRNFTSNHLDTFSIAFDDANFDESAWQMRMAKFLGTEHQVVRATHADIGRVFPEVIWHTEVPVVRTAPAPMFLLSKLVRDSNYKVVLTGEGADEFLAGYDIFKEAKVRRFWARQPGSSLRPLLLKKLYPDISGLAKNNASFLTAFFREGLAEVESPFYSHALRWRNGRRNTRFFSDHVKAGLNGTTNEQLKDLMDGMDNSWAPLSRAQYLETRIFLSQYLLSSQGDRMGMAHSIEGRFPFLDHRVVEFCNQLPSNLKLRGLKEKYLLKQLGRKWLPAEIWQRPKRPYRAPIHRSFFNDNTQDYVMEVLSPGAIKAGGYFNLRAVTQLVSKVRQGNGLGETDDMALAGIISTQLLHRQFIERFRGGRALGPGDNVKVVRDVPG